MTIEQYREIKLKIGRRYVKNFDQYIEMKDEDGYVPFNYFRELGQNQYASRYAHGRIEQYLNLGVGLRWKNLDNNNYHILMIHIDDLATFHDRVNKYKLGG